MKRALALLAVAPLSVVLAGCGGSSDDSTAAASGTPAPTATASAQPTIQPCDAIDTARLEKVLGYAVSKNTGTTSDPSCVLTPAVRGGAIFQLNYQWWFKGGLDASWDSISKQIKGATSTITVPGADSARLVVRSAKGVAYVTGFVENDGLVQLANAEAKKKDKAVLKHAVREVLAQLSAGAPKS